MHLRTEDTSFSTFSESNDESNQTQSQAALSLSESQLDSSNEHRTNDLFDLLLTNNTNVQGRSSSNPNYKPKRHRERLDHLTYEEKMMRRKLKNRISAQSARDRRKLKMKELQDRFEVLLQEKAQVVQQNELLKMQNKFLEQENVQLKQNLHQFTLPTVHESNEKQSIDSSVSYSTQDRMQAPEMFSVLENGLSGQSLSVETAGLINGFPLKSQVNTCSAYILPIVCLLWTLSARLLRLQTITIQRRLQQQLHHHHHHQYQQQQQQQQQRQQQQQVKNVQCRSQIWMLKLWIRIKLFTHHNHFEKSAILMVLCQSLASLTNCFKRGWIKQMLLFVINKVKHCNNINICWQCLSFIRKQTHHWQPPPIPLLLGRITSLPVFQVQTKQKQTPID